MALRGVVRRRLLGVGFVVLVVLLLAASVGAYEKVFTPSVDVTMTADHTGLQMDRGADVKLRGVVVGQVRDISADGTTARLRLALDPDQVRRIPANVTAVMLPKTLFGEKYVALTPPPAPSSAPIAAGATIRQDRSAGSVELERVLDDVIPLLRALPPDKVSVTLSALANALRGRGEQIGDTLVTLDKYLKVVNRQLPTIQADVRKLADVLQTYTGALPDLMTILSNVTVTASTVTEQRANLAAFTADTTGLADTATPFLQRHEGRLIQLGQVSRPLLDVLAEYSPEYPCLTSGMLALQKNIEGAFDGGRLHITLEITKDNGKYAAGDEPVYGADTGPNCRGLPQPTVPFAGPDINDGYRYGAPHSGGLLNNDTLGGVGGGTGSVDMGYAGTAEERAVVDPLVAAATDRNVTQVGGIDDLLWGPLMRGSVVSAK